MNTQSFKGDLDTVVNALRKDGILKDLVAMKSICNKNPDADIGSMQTNAFGFRCDSDNNSYYIKANPVQGDYNFYIYCYQKDVLEQYLSSQHQEQSGPNMDQSM